MKTKIIVLAANPHNMNQLQLDEEVRAIDLALRQAQFRDLYDLEAHWAVRIEDLQELLLRHQPDIVHFSGHATADGGIILQNAEGGSASVPSEALRDLFRLLKDNIRCVVLNACYSAAQATAIAKQIDVVIGMSNTITDVAAITFAAAFYRALAFGRSIKTAFELGRNQIALAGLSEQEIPQLVARQSDPARLTIPANLLYSSAHYFWGLLSIIPLFFLFYYLSQIIFRWFDIDQAFLSFAVNLLQVIAILLALFGISTDWGRKAVSTVWDEMVRRIPLLRHSRTVFYGVAFTTVIAILFFYLGLPIVAAQINAAALDAMDRGEYSAAERKLRQVVSLAPQNARYHYNLGRTYESAGNNERALSEYQTALDLDDSFWPTYQNLSFLYLTEYADPERALQIALAGVALIERSDSPLKDDQVSAQLALGILRKNVGQIYLEMNLLEAALRELARAQQSLETYEAQTNNTGSALFYLAETQRLTALAYENLGDIQSARLHWSTTEGYARSFIESKFCREQSGLTNFSCFIAQGWAEEAQAHDEQLGRND